MTLIVSTTKMTAEQFQQLGEDPPGIRLELVEGEVAVSPSATPSHSYTIIQLITLINTHVLQQGLGEVFSDVDTILNQFNVRRPDILYFSKARSHLIGKKAMQGPPDLAIEVMNPSSIEIDRRDKFAQYASAGITFYWIVDPQTKTLQGWQLVGDQYVLIGQGRESESLQLPPFASLSIDLSRLWRKGV